jgi:P27 family predicted phage terminase small subunit
MRGRKPVPTHLKIIRGNPGKRPLPENEPQPEFGAEMPAWLSDVAKEHWPAIATQLEEIGLLTKLDAPALAIYCEAFVQWKSANDIVIKHGPIVKHPKTGYPMRSPYLRVAKDAFDQMIKMMSEFGMTPTSRARVTTTKKKQEKSRLRAVLDAG